jgi:hypothetical protein
VEHGSIQHTHVDSDRRRMQEQVQPICLVAYLSMRRGSMPIAIGGTSGTTEANATTYGRHGLWRVGSGALFLYIYTTPKPSAITADRNKCYGQMLLSRDKPEFGPWFRMFRSARKRVG